MILDACRLHLGFVVANSDGENWEQTLRMLLPLLIPGAYVFYSVLAHYQRPTLALICDSLTFLAGVGLWVALTLHIPLTIVQWLLVAPLALFLSIYFVGNKLCYRFFKDWVHHQMILELGAGKPIFLDAGRSMQPWEWVGGVAIPFAATWITMHYSEPAPLRWLLPITVGGMTIGIAGHALFRSEFFNTDEHNPFMNLARGWLNESKGVSAKRAAQVVEKVRPAPSAGYRHLEHQEYPLIQVPLHHLTQTQTAGSKQLFKQGTKPNVVLIVLESVRSLESGAYGANTSFMPCFDELAGGGLLWKNFYANGSQTVRGELSLLSSFYDQFGGSPLYMRHPKIRIRSLPETLKEAGYSTHWISSYTASFHNKEQFLIHHGIDEIHDDRGLPKNLPKINWGPPDEELYRYAAGILDRQEGPFFAEIMTLTNHWPFEGPYPTSSQTPIVCNDKLYTNFTKGVYYTDYALGKFFEFVRDKPWFDNTIFAITSDHGAWLYPDALGLNVMQKQEAYFRMPMLLYAPKLIKPDVYNGVCSQVDLAPTILDLLGIQSPHSFLGRSIFDPYDNSQRYALMLHWHSWNLRRGNDYLYALGKAFTRDHHNRCARPEDDDAHGDTTFAYFHCDEDLLKLKDDSDLVMRSAEETEGAVQWVSDLLCLIEYLRVHNRVYSDDTIAKERLASPALAKAHPVRS